MKMNSLFISIPQPCGEDFSKMKTAGAGRHCGKCDKVIYDFSQMTDAELLHFVNKHSMYCGRFHHSQLNRPIAPVQIRNNFFQKFAKIAASVIAILTLRSMPAVAQGVVTPPAEQTLKNTATPPAIPAGPVFIKGTIKDDENNPLKNAVISFDELKSTTTDENGAYSITLNGINEPHNIYFSCVNYVTTVRTYHPAMGNTDFNVVMGRRDTNAVVFSDHLMGVSVPPFSSPEEYPVLLFRAQNTKLDNSVKAILTKVAAKMKANPESSFEISATPLEHDPKGISLKRLAAIKKYLVTEEGIAEERISTNSNNYLGSKNTIEIKALY